MRVKGGYVTARRRKRLMKLSEGYYGRRKNCKILAKEMVDRGLAYAFHGRKLKKRDYRSLWITRISGALTTEAISYSRFIGGLKSAEVALDRKALAEIALHDPEGFKTLVELASAAS